jgi:hypothetical protein
MPETPIACTLNASEYRDRTAALAALAAGALRSREQIPGGERLVFSGDAEVERDLRAAVAAEASCCSFLHMDLRRTDDGLLLDITGPRDALPIIAELF